LAGPINGRGFERLRLPNSESSQPVFSRHDAQAKVLDERIEIRVVMQQVIPAFDAPGGNSMLFSAE
jgi:hypothetical protein